MCGFWVCVCPTGRCLLSSEPWDLGQLAWSHPALQVHLLARQPVRQLQVTPQSPGMGPAAGTGGTQLVLGVQPSPQWTGQAGHTVNVIQRQAGDRVCPMSPQPFPGSSSTASRNPTGTGTLGPATPKQGLWLEPGPGCERGTVIALHRKGVQLSQLIPVCGPVPPAAQGFCAWAVAL